MKRIIITGLLACCSFVHAEKAKLPYPAKYESFETSVPKTWKLQGGGRLSLNPWHYKLGKKSLQWDFKAKDVIRINNTVGDINRRGGYWNSCFASFGVWIYLDRAMPGKTLRFEFRKAENNGAYFDFPLNFKGWQCAYVRYSSSHQFFDRYGEQSFNRIPDKDTDNILIKAPNDTDGRVLIDLIVYNGLQFGHINFLPLKTPWRPPRLDESNNPLPEKVSEADSGAIRKIKDSLGKIMIVEKDTGNTAYDLIMNNIKTLNIVEDQHGIRGRPLNLPRWHSNRKVTAPFYTENGIPGDELLGFRSGILHGRKDLKYRNSIIARIGYLQTQAITQEQYRKLGNEYVKLWKYLIDQGLNCSYGNGYYYTQCYTQCIAATYLLREFVLKSKIKEELIDYLQYKHYAFLNPKVQRVSMDYFAGAKTLLYGAFLCSDNELKQLQILRFLANKWSAEILTGSDPRWGFKPDGAGYHGGHFAFDYFRNGLLGISEIARLLANSSFTLSDAAFRRLKQAALNIYFYTNRLDVPIFMQGTSVFVPYTVSAKRLPQILKNLALAGKNGCDPELAQAYVNLKAVTSSFDPRIWPHYQPYDNLFEAKYGIKPSSPPQGNISMPYAFLSAQRRADWVAVASGNDIDMRDRGNQYMYHGANGALSITGKDGFFASGNQLAGWDWNRTDGTTCLYMPDLTTNIKWLMFGRKEPTYKTAERKSLQKWAREYGSGLNKDRMLNSGGISWRGSNGCFSTIFAGDRLFNVFRGIKSYFFINNRIYALGSGITSANERYQAQTTLYQKALTKQSAPTFIDGKEITTFPLADTMLDANTAHHLIDPVGNGYFIPAGQKLFVARKQQKSRDTKHKKHSDSTGNFATAWLDHGLKCKDAQYAYVIMPYCDREKLAEFSDRNFQILQQDNTGHVIHDKIDGFYAGIFFKGTEVESLPHIRRVSGPCQIMYLGKDGKLQIAVGSHHDLYKADILRVTLSGQWEPEKTVAGVKAAIDNNADTLLEINCSHAKSLNFTLVRR